MFLMEIIISFLIFIFFVLFQIIFRKTNLIQSLSPFKIFFSAIIFFIICICFFYIFRADLTLAIIIYALIHYMLLLIIFIHLIIGLSKSVSLRIMYEMYDMQNYKITFEELKIKYPLNNMFDKRLIILERNNWIFLKDHKFICTPKAVLLVKLTGFFRNLYNLQITG